MTKMVAGFLLFFVVHSGAYGQSALWEDVPLVKVSDVKLPPTALEGNWKTSEGVRIDEVSKANLHFPTQRELIESLEKTGPKGIRSVADYTLVASGFPLDTVTVRVFIFEEASQCEEWWKKKYEADGWDKHYEKIEYSNVAAVRSVQAPKIAVAFGRVWLTSHHIQTGDEHIKAARYVIEQLTKGKRSLTKP